jgi:NAD(P)H-nitrite reductase large subunit
MIVCHCERVGAGTVEASIAAGAVTLEEVTRMCRAGGRCGSCRLTVEAMLATRTARVDYSVGASV